jgi:hypothetical protein
VTAYEVDLIAEVRVPRLLSIAKVAQIVGRSRRRCAGASTMVRFRPSLSTASSSCAATSCAHTSTACNGRVASARAAVDALPARMRGWPDDERAA